MSKLITIAATLGFLTVSTGQLPKVLKELRTAQIELLKESQVSKWPKAMTLKNR